MNPPADRVRRLHRFLGLTLLLPLLGWAGTGLVFFLKPGYEAAYRSLEVRTYPLEGDEEISWAVIERGRLEARVLRTALGRHLLVRTSDGWAQLDPATGAPRELPEEAELRRLVDDAISGARGRYGEVTSVERRDGRRPGASVRTMTGVAIELDWPTLTLRQSGRDTRSIDALYRVHYLQWTGLRTVDRVLGAVGILLLLLLAGLGVRLAFR